MKKLIENLKINFLIDQNLIMNYRRLLLHLILIKVTDKSLLIGGVTKTLHYTTIMLVFDMDGNVFDPMPCQIIYFILSVTNKKNVCFSNKYLFVCLIYLESNGISTGACKVFFLK